MIFCHVGSDPMSRPKKPKITDADLQGLKYFDLLAPLLERLPDVGTARDRAGNRTLFFDNLLSLLLLYFFSPIITSLRGLQQASGLEKAQNLLGITRYSRGSLSEATTVFDPAPLRAIVQELAAKALPLQTGSDATALKGLVAVDGSVLRALPRMVWALWQDKNHRAVKLHWHFDVLKGVPEDARLTAAACSEPAELARMLTPGRLYVIDRGYASYGLFREILNAGSSFLGRVKDNTAFTVDTERDLTAEARAAGVVRDVVVGKLGTDHHKDVIGQPVRLVIVRYTDRDGALKEIWLATDRLDLPADLVALGYRWRWSVELFFRWLKGVLGCRHLLFEDQAGVTIQVYVALIASLLIVLWTGRKPTRRTWEMIQFYLIGWASLEELEAHLAKLKPIAG